MKIAFMMDRLEDIEPVWETTSHLMYESNQRGHTVYFLEPHDIYIRKNKVMARMYDVTVDPDRTMKQYWRAAIQCLKKEDRTFESLSELDALFLRKNPPLQYQAMEFLSPFAGQVFMLNSTTGQMQGNGKLYTLNFPDIIPVTHVSRDPARLKKIIDDFGGAMIVKPLQRFGGEGVIKVSTKDQENLLSLINYYVRAYEPYHRREPIMVQEYLDEVRKAGDIRILLLNGNILGAMQRKPIAGEFRANVHAGAKVFKHEITKAERKICQTIRKRLRADGLFFVGIDIIGDKLVEINCVSPGGIPRINQLDGVKLEKKVIDFVEQRVATMKKEKSPND
jgi:glutathione synthase